MIRMRLKREYEVFGEKTEFLENWKTFLKQCVAEIWTSEGDEEFDCQEVRPQWPLPMPPLACG
jgi:hypothetical protein